MKIQASKICIYDHILDIHVDVFMIVHVDASIDTIYIYHVAKTIPFAPSPAITILIAAMATIPMAPEP